MTAATKSTRESAGENGGNGCRRSGSRGPRSGSGSGLTLPLKLPLSPTTSLPIALKGTPRRRLISRRRPCRRRYGKTCRRSLFRGRLRTPGWRWMPR
ncbi:hypothetical protein LINGRAHAP2_LOCUS36287 [Linum grandiflorum]